MDPRTLPRLSAILVTPGSFAAIRPVVAHLRAQEIRDAIEIVIVAPSRDELGLDPDSLAGFWGWQVVEVGKIENVGPAEAAGFRRARADVVVYVEEHSWPAPGWAEALVQAHEGPYAAVGPALENANPESMASWSTFLLDFADWVAPGVPGEATTLPSHQTSYKRDVLLAYGDALDRLMETETALQTDLRSKGHRLYFEPAARTFHWNVSRFPEIVGLQFQNYREYAANRAETERWSAARRVAYIVGAPGIPLVRGWRVVRRIRRATHDRRLLPRLLPSLIVGLVAAAVGEAIGYSLGKGDSSRKRVTFELERMRHLSERDRAALARAELAL